MRSIIIVCLWAFAGFLPSPVKAVLPNGSYPAAPSDLEATKSKEVCMKELGCFSITEDFKSLLHRPINVLPQDRATINTKCLLYTRNNSKESQQLFAQMPETIINSNLNPNVPTKFIVHGFMDSELYGPWMVRMKEEFLMHGDYNIIIVDWSGGNKPPYYQATANTRVVGAEIALLLEACNKHKGIPPKDVHLIGHSLGSHICGYAGERVKGIGRITACDPAEPYFQNMPPSVRIDATDADYVDVIHSDATDIMFIGFGMSHMVGHADFFPNNGRKQPGCKTDKFKSFIIEGLNEGARRFVSCNHQRSLDFMHHSINYRKISPVAYECSTWDLFLDGKCADCGSDTSKCAIMGIRADEYKPFRNSSKQRAFYIKTSGSSPFWLYHYHMAVKMYKPKTSSASDLKGWFEVNVHGSMEDELVKLDDGDRNLYPGSQKSFLITTEKELGVIKSVTFKWHSTSKNPIDLIRKPKLYLDYVTVIPMNSIEKSPRNMADKTFCSSNKEKGIASKETISCLIESCKSNL